MAILPKTKLHIITLGVKDRAAMTAFYEDVIGWENVGPPGMAMFDMGGFVLGLWEEDKLAGDAGLPDDRAGTFKALALAYNTESIEQTDEIFAKLDAAGVTITTPPHKSFWGGYSGYFTDLEGNAWEVAYNPFWTFDAAGGVVLPAKESK